MPINLSGTQFQYSAEKKAWRLECPVSFGADGAPTLLAWQPSNSAGPGSYVAAPTSSSVTGTGSPFGARGISSIVRNSAGNFTITLQGQFQRLLQAQVTFLDGSTTNAGLSPTNGSYPPAAPEMFIDWDNTDVAESPGVINVIFNTVAGGGSLTGGTTPITTTVAAPVVGTISVTATAGSITLAGAVVGMPVLTAFDNTTTKPTLVNAAFESVISVAGHIQQTSNSGSNGITTSDVVNIVLLPAPVATPAITFTAAAGAVTATDPAQYETAVIELWFDDSSTN